MIFIRKNQVNSSILIEKGTSVIQNDILNQQYFDELITAVKSP